MVKLPFYLLFVLLGGCDASPMPSERPQSRCAKEFSYFRSDAGRLPQEAVVTLEPTGSSVMFFSAHCSERIYPIVYDDSLRLRLVQLSDNPDFRIAGQKSFAANIKVFRGVADGEVFFRLLRIENISPLSEYPSWYSPPDPSE